MRKMICVKRANAVAHSRCSAMSGQGYSASIYLTYETLAIDGLSIFKYLLIASPFEP
jgi:hypothetical protein